MSNNPPPQSEARLAGARLRDTLSTLATRLKPAELQIDARAAARERAVKLAVATLSSRRGRPLVAVGVIVAGTAYLLRKPLSRVLAQRLSKEKSHDNTA